MQKRIGFLPPDAWVLLAILYAGRARAASLREIIAAADFINHAILTYEELAGGLARLSRAGTIRRQGETGFQPSPAVRAYYEKNTGPKGRVQQDLELISSYIGAGPWRAGKDPRNAAQENSVRYIDRDAFERAVASYLNSVHK